MNWIATGGIALLVLSGAYISGYQSGKNSVIHEDTKITLERTEAARTTEHTMNVSLQKEDAAYQRGVLDGKNQTDLINGLLSSGALRVPEPTPAPTCPANPRPAAKSECPAPAGLPVQTVKDLVRLAGEANDVTRQLAGCQKAYRNVQTELNKYREGLK